MDWYDKTQISHGWTQEEAQKFVKENKPFFFESGFRNAIATPFEEFLDVVLYPNPNCKCDTFDGLYDIFGGEERDGVFWTVDKSGRFVRFRIQKDS